MNIASKINLLRHKIIPDTWWDVPFDELGARDRMAYYGSWSLIAWDWIRPFAEWVGDRKCLEIMAGHGMWSKALRDCGVNVLAVTDDMSWVCSPPTPLDWFQRPEQFWMPVENIDCEAAVRAYPAADLILCSWPYDGDDGAYRSLLAMREVCSADTQFVMIGRITGATGCYRFHKNAHLINDLAFERAVEKYRSEWRDDLADWLYLFR